MGKNGSCSRRRGWSVNNTIRRLTMTVSRTGWLRGIDVVLTPLCCLFSHVDFRIGTAVFNLLAGSRRQALGPKNVDKIDQSRRWLYGVAACFIGALASPGATLLMLPTSAAAVPLPWTSFVGVLAPFSRTNCVMRRLGSAYCRAEGAKPVRSAAAGAQPPSLLVHASALFGLIFGISGTIARVVRGMGHDIAACVTCYSAAAPLQRTTHFRPIVTTSSHMHVEQNHHSTGRLQPMYRATDHDTGVVVVASPLSTWREASCLQGNMRVRRYSHLQLHVAVPAYSQVTHSVRVMQLQLPARVRRFLQVSVRPVLSVYPQSHLQFTCNSKSSKCNIKLYSMIEC